MWTQIGWGCCLETERYIKERIEESRRRFQNKKTYECPACTAQCGKAEKILEHMMRCCADLLVNEVRAEA